MNASLKKDSSYTWQSIMAGMKTFKLGAIWRPGNGASIDIWSDQWIPTSHDRKVMTPRGLCLLQKVQDLIDPISGNWDEQLVRENFGWLMQRGYCKFRCHLMDNQTSSHGIFRSQVALLSAQRIILHGKMNIGHELDWTREEAELIHILCGSCFGEELSLLKYMCSIGGCYMGSFHATAH